jgi:hypothetical protein
VPHGSTFRDWASERTNHPRDVAEMALAHAIGNRVEAAYRRGDLFEKRRRLGAKFRVGVTDTRIQIIAVDFHHVTTAVNKRDRAFQGVPGTDDRWFNAVLPQSIFNQAVEIGRDDDPHMPGRNHSCDCLVGTGRGFSTDHDIVWSRLNVAVQDRASFVRCACQPGEARRTAAIEISLGRGRVRQPRRCMHYPREILERRNADPDQTIAGGLIDLGGFATLVHGHDLKRAINIKVRIDLSDDQSNERLPLTEGLFHSQFDSIF